MKRNIISLILIGLFSFNILAWIIVYDLSKDRFLEVSFFNVGQGDAILIVTPKRHQILIDGGPNSVILEKLAKEIPFWDRSIDLVILTHTDTDHLNGLVEVLKKYKVEKILYSKIIKNTSLYQEWLKLIKKEKAIIFSPQAGQKIKTGKVYLDIFWPLENLEGKKIKNDNNFSVVAKLNFNQNSFLFTGDIGKLEEKKLIENGFNINSDILKIAHHGGRGSSRNEFIEEVSPQFAVISSGKNNRYGHPHQEVLETLNKYDLIILRTDQQGDIKFISNGKNYAFSHF